MRKGWKYKRIGDVCSVIGGATPKTEIKEFWGGSHYWITPADLNGNKYQGATPRTITDVAVQKTNLQLLPVGTVLLSSRAPIGKVAITTEAMYCNQGFKNIVCSGILNNEFVYWYLYFSKDYLNSLGTGATFKEISKKTTENIMIPVPPLQEQERIVAELDLLTEIIDKQKQQLKELDTLAQSIFYDMFGNPVENEKGWELKSLGDISVKIANGYNAKLEEGTYKTEGVMYFRCQNVWRNRFDYSDLVYIDEQTNAMMKSSSLKKNDFVITKIGRLFTENSSLGRVSLYEGEDDKANISGNLCFVRLKEGVCHKFILYILISEHFRDYVRNTTTGGIDKRALNCKQVASYNVILPPLELQKVFSEKVKAIESQKQSINRSIAESQKLFDYTMDKYFG